MIFCKNLCHSVFLIGLFTFFHCGHCNLKHVQTFEGAVGAENFTYYKLVLEGHVVVKLHTSQGDADLYLSTETLKPTWTDYTMKSDTCGHEIVLVRRHHTRPVGIGVYGYVHHPVSKYQLSVYVDNQQSYYPEKNLEETQKTSFYKANNLEADLHFSSVDENDEESIFWSIFVGLLKFILEILI